MSMTITEIINVIVNNGLAVGITAYFLYRDFVFNKEMLETLGALKECVTELKGLTKNENNE